MRISRHEDKTLHFAHDFNLKKGQLLYKLLKRDLYYEHVNLYQRAAIAQFEAGDFKTYIQQFVELINLGNPEKSDEFKDWLDGIKYRVFPKKIALSDEQDTDGDAGSFISNLRISERYYLADVNYFCDMSIQLLLISMLWSVTTGVLLDRKIGVNCIGNRLNLKKGKDFEDNSINAFKYYLPEYNRWRDQAIKVGLDALEASNDILLIGMDIRRCFYSLKTNWEEIRQAITDATIEENEKEFCHKITTLLEMIHVRYFEEVRGFLQTTHSDSSNFSENKPSGLPIGLPSSRILANWELNFFDKTIVQKLRPIYYGRYVDDFLIVINNPGRDKLSQSTIIDKFFINSNILTTKTSLTEKKDKKNIEAYKISDIGTDRRFEYLEIQTGKLVFHFYAHEGSWAGLKEFQDELNRQASEFRFLPVQDRISEFIDDAHDIHYDGGQNKLRSVIGVKENSNKLSNQLYSRMLRYWLANQSLKNSEINQLTRFYQGRNIFDYARTWERVLTLLVGTNQLAQCISYYHEIYQVINKLVPYEAQSHEKPSAHLITNHKLINKARHDLIEYLNIAFASALSLESEKNRKGLIEREEIIRQKKDILKLARSIRLSFMVRHQFVRWPLVEYLYDDINLINFEFNELTGKSDVDLTHALEYAPRFIYFHEYALLHYLRTLVESGENPPNNLLTSNEDVFNNYKNIWTTPDVKFEEPAGKNKHDEKKITIKFKSNRKNKRFYIGVANIQVLEQNFKASYKPNEKPNLSLERQEDLFHIINEAIRGPRCDLIVLPEVSIPYMWLPFMANMSRKHKIGMVFGLEHLVINGVAYNLIATILPFGNDHSLQNSFISLRVKNHYSPEEKLDLESYDLKIPSSGYYEKILWRNCWFAAYNCFELTNIKARGLFRSELDLLVSIVCNKDINYYSNILEASAIDLHTYIVQANTSDYGDSRIVAPQKTEEKDIIRVKGGENPILLKGYIDIEKLRDFQSHKYTQSDNRFKPTPAGFDHDKARKRSK